LAGIYASGADAADQTDQSDLSRVAREIADGGVSKWGCRQLVYGNEEHPGLEVNPADPLDPMNPFPLRQ